MLSNCLKVSLERNCAAESLPISHGRGSQAPILLQHSIRLLPSQETETEKKEVGVVGNHYKC